MELEDSSVEVDINQTTEAAKTVENIVELWPVYEYTGLMAELMMLQDRGTDGEMENLETYKSLCSPAALTYNVDFTMVKIHGLFLFFPIITSIRYDMI